MILLYIFLALVFLVLVLIFTPIHLVLSTEQNQLYISYGKVLKASAALEEADISVRFYILGFSRSSSLLEMLAGIKRKKSIQEKVADKIAETTKRAVPVDYILAFLKSFSVQRFYINVDLGSVYYNAWLFPLGEIFAQKNVYCTTNFSGKTEADINIKNSLASMGWALTTAYFKNKKP